MRTTLTIDDDILQVAKHLAGAERRTIGEVISELARRGLRPEEPSTSNHGLPVFDVPKTAPPLTPEMVRRALDE